MNPSRLHPLRTGPWDANKGSLSLSLNTPQNLGWGLDIEESYTKATHFLYFFTLCFFHGQWFCGFGVIELDLLDFNWILDAGWRSAPKWQRGQAAFPSQVFFWWKLRVCGFGFGISCPVCRNVFKFPLSEAAETLFDYGNGKELLHSITFCEAKYDRNGVVPIDLISAER